MADSLYSDVAKKYPLLTTEQEINAAILAEKGDKESKELMILSNIRLVKHIAAKYSWTGNLEDLVQEGVKGLIKAVDNFKPIGYRVSTYAKWWIKQAILNYISSQGIIHIPREKNVVLRQIYNFATKYIIENSKEPTNEQIAYELNKKSKTKYDSFVVASLLDSYHSSKTTSLDKELGNETGLNLLDIVEPENECSPHQNIDSESVLELVNSRISCMDVDKATKRILQDRLYDGRLLSDLALELHISKERVRQKYERGLRILRESLLKSPGFEYLIE